MRGFQLAVSCFALFPSLTWAQAPRPVPTDSITVEGVLQIGEFFGPPNYGENPKSDRLERTLYLQLPAPLTYQTNGTQLVGPDLTSEFFLQLVVHDILQPTAHTLIGQRVRVRGSLMPAVSGHHRTTQLLEVVSIHRVTDWEW